jgi:hypothetical protein
MPKPGTSDSPIHRKGKKFVPVGEIPDEALNPEEALLQREAEGEDVFARTKKSEPMSKGKDVEDEDLNAHRTLRDRYEREAERMKAEKAEQELEAATSGTLRRLPPPEALPSKLGPGKVKRLIQVGERKKDPTAMPADRNPKKPAQKERRPAKKAA